MRKLSTLAIATVVAASLATSAFAGPSRALIQEMGSVVPAGEVNIDLGIKGITGLVLPAPIGAVNVGSGNGTVGAIGLDSVNVGLGNNFEVRTGNLPGISGLLTGAGQGVTVKYAGFVPGLAVYGGYGNTSNTAGAAAPGGAATTTSTMRIGAAYTMPVSSFILNGSVQIGNDTAVTTSNVTEFTVAALYPLSKDILVGGEYLNSSAVNGGTTIGASAFGLGGRATLGKFTVDALLYTNATVTVTGMQTNANTTQMGYPAMIRINYAF